MNNVFERADWNLGIFDLLIIRPTRINYTATLGTKRPNSIFVHNGLSEFL
jgi:hypothetical protein